MLIMILSVWEYGRLQYVCLLLSRALGMSTRSFGGRLPGGVAGKECQWAAI
jgi:hypothetical protein